MYIRHHDDSFVKATVYPHASPDADPRFLATAPHFVAPRDGEVFYNAKPVTLTEEAQRVGEYLMALAVAEKIAGRTPNRNAVEALVGALQQWIDGVDWGHLAVPPNAAVSLCNVNIAGDLTITGVNRKG